jgi:hypothetical protein
MAISQSTTALRGYRIYLRNDSHEVARPHDVELPSDEEARQLAALMLDEQGTCPCAEVWDRSRLVATVRREG